MIIGEYIPAKIEESFLALWNEAQFTRSNGKIQIWYFDEREEFAGGIEFSFEHSYFSACELRILFCAAETSTIQFMFPTQLEWARDIIILKRGHNTRIYCYGTLIVDFTTSFDTCDDPQYLKSWNKYWDREVFKIKFPQTDFNSDPVIWDTHNYAYAYYIGK